MHTLPLRFLLFIALVAALGSALYYAAPVTALGLFAVAAAALAGAALLPVAAASAVETARGSGRRSDIATAVAGSIGLAAWWNAIAGIAITEAARSPWGSVDPFALAGLGAAFFASILLLQRNLRIGAALFVAALFSSLALAAVVYPLGFGFDPFLHRATVAHIAEYGTIAPKPLYYIGQYALELVFSLKGLLSLGSIDRFLLPVLASVMLTISAWYGLRSRAPSRMLLAGLVFLPFAAFISTTPQGLAYVFALSAILLTFASGTAWPSALLALAALLTHPFAGVPAALFVAAALLRHRAAHAAATAVAVLAVPALFAVQAARSGLSLNADFAHFVDPARWHALVLPAFFTNNFSTGFDALYLVVNNLLLIAATVGIIGYILHRRTVSALPLFFSAAMIVNFLTLSILFDFDFLIDYERQDYAVRSLTLAQLFLVPYACLAVAALAKRLAEKPLALHAAFLALLAFIGTANAYGAYPRHDNYARSAGFNVSAADFDAVYAISEQSGGRDYIVLSNQATAAAAVEAFGFAKYYHGDIFYYPIPTGGPLYQQYLAMVNDGPSRERMFEAMDIAGVDLGFFAVNSYWWQSEQIIENAKRIADDWFSVADGQVTVFLFDATRVLR